MDHAIATQRHFHEQTPGEKNKSEIVVGRWIFFGAVSEGRSRERASSKTSGSWEVRSVGGGPGDFSLSSEDRTLRRTHFFLSVAHF